MKSSLHQRHLGIAISYFAIAAVLGLLLRYYSIFSFGFNYRYMVHAHSHIALLGWVYVALTTLLHYCFMDKKTPSKRYRHIFWGTQGTLIGMLLTFPFQGYALFSILFSTLFLIVSYVYTYHFWKNIDPKYQKRSSLQCAKAALVYMVTSSLGPWALGAIMSTLGAQSIWYRLSIYFYLHFQYNGWMLLALLGLFLYVLEQRDLIIPQKSFVRFFQAINIGIVLSFFLSTLWTEPSVAFYLLGGLGAIVQLYALIYLWALTKAKVDKLHLSNLQNLLLQTVVILTGLKILLQLLTALPYFAQMAATYLDFTIGYLHLTFLGVISFGLFFFMDHFRLFRMSKKSYLLYFLGFLLTECLIFYKGIAAWQEWGVFSGYMSFLSICSLLILFGVLTLLVKNLSKTQKTT
ncbi:hypothetical protein SAMN04487891_113121 [Flagellimonas taeanensis]|uniref:Cytochrome C and Quinol oxidase polypeptide I n=1 Tax=Flagellimonas taeanensis TaxID=1005926 RepID=A0A1M6UJG2_9FLAO|nr:hypothetical protein [Allomuricauda taeanensis]SFC55570.1 hypothetical protein SAMN04487891_113121 [Allomuricauda taeanensis]SHK69352.1 hypothetical protein SAMN05216293_1645 [Allomuricauda taeanensis]